MAKKKFLFSWDGFKATKYVGGVVTDTDKDTIVLTFKSVKPFDGAVFGDFETDPEKTVLSATIDPTDKTITIVVSVAFAFGNEITVTYTPSKPKGTAITVNVTNEIAE